MDIRKQSYKEDVRDERLHTSNIFEKKRVERLQIDFGSISSPDIRISDHRRTKNKRVKE